MISLFKPIPTGHQNHVPPVHPIPAIILFRLSAFNSNMAGRCPAGTAFPTVAFIYIIDIDNFRQLSDGSNHQKPPKTRIWQGNQPTPTTSPLDMALSTADTQQVQLSPLGHYKEGTDFLQLSEVIKPVLTKPPKTRIWQGSEPIYTTSPLDRAFSVATWQAGRQASTGCSSPQSDLPHFLLGC